MHLFDILALFRSFSFKPIKARSHMKKNGKHLKNGMKPVFEKSCQNPEINP